MNELIELNRKKNLGLRIRRTIRLRRNDNGKSTLIMTKLNVPEEYTIEQDREFKKDIRRQVKILEKHGYVWYRDVFMMHIDPKTNEATAVIADFGQLYKPK